MTNPMIPLASTLIADLRTMRASTEYDEIPSTSREFIISLLDSDDAPAMIRSNFDSRDADEIIEILESF